MAAHSSGLHQKTPGKWMFSRNNKNLLDKWDEINPTDDNIKEYTPLVKKLRTICPGGNYARIHDDPLKPFWAHFWKFDHEHYKSLSSWSALLYRLKMLRKYRESLCLELIPGSARSMAHHKGIYNLKRPPSATDRVLTRGNFKTIKYWTPILDQTQLRNGRFSLSDHAPVMAVVQRQMQATGAEAQIITVFTFNCAEQQIDISSILVERDYNALLVCLQEVPRGKYSYYINTISSLANQKGMKIVINEGMMLSNVFGKRVMCIYAAKPGAPGFASILTENYQKLSSPLSTGPRRAFSTKSAVGIVFNSDSDKFTVMSVHFSFLKKNKNQGLEQRISEMKIVHNKLPYKDAIIAGDMNFRILNERNQLTNLLSSENANINFREGSTRRLRRTYKLSQGLNDATIQLRAKKQSWKPLPPHIKKSMPSFKEELMRV